jgi:hypothetical protein
MNQKQRDYLTDLVKKQGRKALDDLEEKKPLPPSLNNYLVAAALSRTLILKSSESLAEAISDMVLTSCEYCGDEETEPVNTDAVP